MSLVDGPSVDTEQTLKWVRHASGCAIWKGADACTCPKPEPIGGVDISYNTSGNQGILNGVKADQGKPRLGLVLVEVPHALEKLGTLLGFGADKYSVGNWDKVPEGEMRYLDALMRHLTSHHKGEKVDPESGELHLAHAAVNIMFLLDKELRK